MSEFNKHGNPTVTLNSDDPFDSIIIAMVEMNRRKRKDYAGDRSPWANFYDSADQLQNTPGHSVETLIATKQARLKTLLPALWTDDEFSPSNEPIEDTLLDRAVYSVIALAIWREGGYTVGE